MRSVQVTEYPSNMGNINYPLNVEGIIHLSGNEVLPTGLLVYADINVPSLAARPIVKLTQVEYTSNSVLVQVSVAGVGVYTLTGSYTELNTVTTISAGVQVTLTLGPHGPLPVGTYTPLNSAPFILSTVTASPFADPLSSLAVHAPGDLSGSSPRFTEVGSDSGAISVSPSVSLESSVIASTNTIHLRPTLRGGTYDPCAEYFESILRDITQGGSLTSTCAGALFSVNGLEADWGGDLQFVGGSGVQVDSLPEHHAIILTTGKDIGDAAGRNTHTLDQYSYVEGNIEYTAPQSSYYLIRLLEDGNESETILSYFTNSEILEGIAYMQIENPSSSTPEEVLQDMISTHYNLAVTYEW